ncbi:selenium cofactor biosynthesis protein YqeC [Garciella nitratireducens]|uniref:selenium cofactor biosynthesis protein YqeC n=1 Tax=Garciella nitratireducens TaxID=218205 RepID=UPI001BD6B228|nr:selenium cofactor biosynthesis protein YqeC [Garciella nitratireducens]
MNFYQVLNIKKFPKVISFIGGGGKTTAIFLLAREYDRLGKKILITTTTHFSLNQGNKASQLIIEPEYNKAIYQIKKYEKQHQILCLATKILKDKRKLKGVPQNWIEKIKREEIFDIILVEADGARRKPFKVPAEHEPVLPRQSDKIIAVMGIEALNRPITSQYIHRPERALFLLGKNEEKNDTLLTEEYISKIFFHKQGILKEIDREKEVYILINKVDKEKELKAFQLAYQLRKESTFPNLKILIGQIQDLQNPIKFIIE